MKCAHCSLGDILNSFKKEFSLNEIEAALGEYDLSEIYVIITGGEPFLRRDIVSLVKFFIEKGTFKVDIETNGAIDLRTLNQLSKISRNIYLAVSIDGFEAEHEQLRGIKGSFKAAVKTVKIAKKLGITTGVNMVLNKWNDRYLPKFVNFILNDLRADMLRILLLLNLGRAKNIQITTIDKLKQIKFLIPLIRKYHSKISHNIPPALLPPDLRSRTDCGWAEFIIGINPDLSVSLCSRTTIRLADGSLLNKRIEKLFNSARFKYLRKIRKDKRLWKGVCNRCQYFIMCRGGCRIEAYATYGNFSSPSPLCQSLYEMGLFPKHALEL